MTLRVIRPAPDPVVRLADPGAVVAALPVLLGFHPRDSLVLLALRDRGVELTLRLDLPPPREVDAACAAAVGNLLLGRPDAAAVIVVGGASTTTAPLAPVAPVAPPRRDVARASVAALGARGLAARIVVWAASCGSGARWRCYRRRACAGRTPDPGSTPLAALAVAQGLVVYADRADLEALLAPVDAAVLARRAALLVARRPGRTGRGTGDAAAVVHRALADTRAGRLQVDDDLVVDLAQELDRPEVRDAALRTSCGPHAAAAEQLWAALARETPPPQAATPAALLAVSALLGGREALATIALDRADQAWPGHRLATLLREAVEVGLRPQQLRAWIDQS